MEVNDAGTMYQCQLINDDSELDLAKAKEFVNLPFNQNRGTDYNVVAIIGAQSSGKSTLLNRLFDTKFIMLNTMHKREQVTKGVWMAGGPDHNVVVLDVEGSDSKERWEERNSYEQSVALFALALANVLIINLWTHDIGRFTASNYGIIRVIFELNIKLFKQETPKRLLIVLRDFTPDEENFSVLTQTVKDDIVKIWSEIAKPAEMKDWPPERLFKIDFFALPHFKYARKDFDEQSGVLKERFRNKDAVDNVFKDFDQSKNLPMDSVPLYMEKLWSTIKSNKDLNLPSQKMIVSHFRCAEIKTEIHDKASSKITELKNKVGTGFYDKFKEECQKIIDNATAEYDEATKDYAKEAAEEHHKELESRLMSDFQETFQVQLGHIKKKMKEEMELGLKQLENVTTDITKKLRALQEKLNNHVISSIEASTVKKGSWNEHALCNDCLDSITSTLNQFKDKKLKLFLMDKKQGIKKTLERQIVTLFEDLDEASASKLEVTFNNTIQTLNQEVTAILKSSFELPHEEISVNINRLDEQAYNTFKEVVHSRMYDFTNYLIKKFKSIFSKNERGHLRNWRSVKEEDIQELFQRAKATCLKILQSFRNTHIQKKWDIETPTGDDLIELEFDVLGETEYRTIESKFLDEADNICTEALRIHASRDAGKIPKWMWLLLVFFMYDDVLQWLRSPYLAVPLMLIVCVLLLLHFIGLGQLPKALLELVTGVFTNKLTPQLLRFGMK